MNPNGWRRILAGTCETLGVVALVLGVLLGYCTRSIFNSEAFADRAAASLAEPGVSAFVAGKIADGVIAAQPDLTGVRPLIIAGGRSVVSSVPFRLAARRAALELHKTIMSGTGEKIMLSVHDVGEILKATVAMNPDVAKKLPKRLSARLANLDDLPAGELAARLVRAAHRARVSFLVLMIGGFALLACGIALSRDSNRALYRAGIAVASGAFLLWIVARFGGWVVGAIPHDPNIGLLASGIWRAFVGDLRHWALGLGLVGVVIASASASARSRAEVDDRLRASWRWLVTPPERRTPQFLRGLGAVAVGVLAFNWPLAVLSVFAVVLGALGTFLGLRECFAAIVSAIPDADLARAQAAARSGAGRSRLGMAAVALLAVAIAVGVWLWLSRTPAGPIGPTAITACNGFPELCDRRLDQVVFATTHNSMGGADNPGWLFPNQSKSIPAQLDDGVRGFMIDAHYGMPVGDKVKTLMEEGAASMAKYEAAVGKEGMEAALRIRDRLVGGDESQKAVYMAHGFCELGAIPLRQTFEEMRDFLVANPGEILVIIIQDEGVTPSDIAKVFEESGLIDFVYRGPVTKPWPTLRWMAENNQRVVVFAENRCEGVPWYHPAFETIQETPYTFHDPSQFSEKPNRGGTGGSLLLMNHWIESTPMPKPSNAEIVNAYDFLLKRARRCQRERGHVVNFVAVDFYASGDLFRVVRTLNGIKS